MDLDEMIKFLPMLVQDMADNPEDYPLVCPTCEGWEPDVRWCMVCSGTGVVPRRKNRNGTN